MVEDLEGSDEAKKRMKVILETLAGQRTIMDACMALGIGKSAFHELRKRVLQAALSDVEPRPSGRPPAPEPPEASEVDRLKTENDELRTRLEVAHVREEILLAMPEVFEPGRKAGEKGGSPSPTSEKKKGGKRGRRASRISKPSISLWSCGSSACGPKSCTREGGGALRRTRSDGRSSGR
jgi:transposase-like protein